MQAAQRRAEISALLHEQPAPISAAVLAARFSVSRQVIVGDIALLRASGENIAATPRGYAMVREQAGILRTVACIHRTEEMDTELYLMVDHGCDVLDVVVEHPVYGQLTGELQLRSRYDVDQFLRRVAEHAAKPLSDLTAGIHLHTLRCPDEAAYQRVLDALKEAGFLLKE